MSTKLYKTYKKLGFVNEIVFEVRTLFFYWQTFEGQSKYEKLPTLLMWLIQKNNYAAKYYYNGDQSFMRQWFIK